MSQIADGEVRLAWDQSDRLHKAMRIANMTTLRLSEELGVHRNTVNNYLSGKSPIDRRTLIAWAFACGVPFEWLETGQVTGDGDPGGRGNGVTGG